MIFKVEYDNYLSNEGVYEVFIKSAREEQSTFKDKTYINVCLVVRKDVDQADKGKVFYHKIYKSSYADNISGYASFAIFNICKACNVPEGKEFSSLEELLKYLEGKCVRVSLINKEYNGKYYLNVAKWMNTEHPTENISYDENTPTDDHIPF